MPRKRKEIPVDVGEGVASETMTAGAASFGHGGVNVQNQQAQETVGVQEARLIRAKLVSLRPLMSYPMTDPRIMQLNRLVAEYGILRPLVISSDNYILDGNKLYTVLVATNQEEAPAWVIPGIERINPLDFSKLYNIHSILNLRLPYTHTSAIEPLLDTLRLELSHYIVGLLPKTTENL